MVVVLLFAGMPPQLAQAASAHGMVASGHPLATQAGVEVLKSGGNAIDAAVAIGLTLGVVDTPNSGIGGGCFLLIRLANGEFAAIDGREMAPAAATRDLFVRDGKADPELSQTGALASGVPGEVAAFEYAVIHYGRKRFDELLLPAAALAQRGFRVSRSYANSLRSVEKEIARFESAHAVFFRKGRPFKAGELLKLPDLAATYRQLARSDGDWFYRGPFAQAVEKWMGANGGIITAQDFANYRVAVREPVRTIYRGYEVISFAPPSSGGVHLIQMLNILDHFDLAKLDEPIRWHVIAEAMKLAFADRAYWLGDPDFAPVPRGLVSREYATALAKRIDLRRATKVPTHGEPSDWNSDLFKRHTTHFSVADAEGNWVACTATINTSFGSKVVIPGTGVVMNNQMDDFSAQPGVANYFGLIGAEANAVAPGKRPLSSMTPTIVLKDGQPVISLGAAGGPKIITTVLLELINLIDLKLTPRQALAAPRIHHQWSPDELMVESSFPESLRRALTARGHKVKVLSAMSTSQIVVRAPESEGFTGAADPRAGGSAAGW